MTDNSSTLILTFLLGVSLTLAACSESSAGQTDTTGGSGTGVEQSSDRNLDNGGSDGNGQGSLGNSGESCEVVSTTATEWSEKTSLGTPEKVFSTLAGTCTAPFQWDGGGWDNTLTVKPATGESTITATVELDRSSIRFVERQATSNATSLERYHCDALLEIDALVTLELPQGVMVENRRATVSKSPEEDAQGIGLYLEPADIDDWISIEVSKDNSTLEIFVFIMPINDGCVGEISLMTRTDFGSSGVGVAGSGFATWSDTGCGLERFPIDLDELAQDIDLNAAVKDTFNQVEFRGTWEDGGGTNLMLEVSVTETKVCYETMGETQIISIPVNVAMNSSDNRIRSLSGKGTVQATIMDTGLAQLDLWSSIDLHCQSESDTLAYQTADCNDVESVTAQLSFNVYRNVEGPDGGILELYIYQRNSNASPGSADQVDRLQLVR